MDLHALLALSVQQHASDLHVSSGCRPMLRIDGTLQGIAEHPCLDPIDLQQALFALLPARHQQDLSCGQDYDFCYENPDLGRFRANYFWQLRGISAVFRLISQHIPTLAQLEAPDIFRTLCQAHQGLILVTGPTGSGKSSTLAAMINEMNQNTSRHIITIEQPIEYVYPRKQALIQQREVGMHTKNFQQALHSALREDPDVLLVGELRDIQTTRQAIGAAETGHLVMATLHTNSAPEAVDRIINLFPANEQIMIRGILANALQAVIAQRLIPKVGGGRVAAFEIMLCNNAVRHLIREQKIAQITSAMQMGQSEGMCTYQQAWDRLIQSGQVVVEK